jgi:hypothetical protein
MAPKKEQNLNGLEGLDDLHHSPSQDETTMRIDDAVFGEVSEDGPNYRNVIDPNR